MSARTSGDGAMVPYGQPPGPLAQYPGAGRRSNLQQQVGQYRPMPRDLKQYLDALAGPSERVPLIYTGDPGASLDRLHADVVSHYRQLSAALGEHERQDLINHAPPLAGLSFGNLSMAGPSPPLLLGQASPSGAGLSLASFVSPGRPSQLPGSSFHPASDLLRSSSSPLQLLGSYAPPPGGLLGPAWGGRPGVASAPAGHAHMDNGVRASSFAVLSQQGDDSSLMTDEASQLLYPPVGSTFEGRPSRVVEAARRGGGGIDSMADMQYKRAVPLQYDDVLRDMRGGGAGGTGAERMPFALGPMSAARSRSQGDRDQLDSFLMDFAVGRAPAPPPASSALSVGGGRAYKPSHVYRV